MIYFADKGGEIVKTLEFPIDVLIVRNCSRKQVLEYKHLPCYRVTKFAERLLFEGPYRKKLYEEGLDRTKYCAEDQYRKWNRGLKNQPFQKDRYRCFLAQDIANRKNNLRQQQVEEVLKRFHTTLVVKAHPVHVYKGGRPLQNAWWEERCKAFNIPYLDFEPQDISRYSQVISFYSTGFRWAPSSDNVLLTQAYLPMFCGGRFITTLDEVEEVREINEQELQWRKQRYCWLQNEIVFDRPFDFEKIERILRYQELDGTLQ